MNCLTTNVSYDFTIGKHICFDNPFTTNVFGFNMGLLFLGGVVLIVLWVLLLDKLGFFK